MSFPVIHLNGAKQKGNIMCVVYLNETRAVRCLLIMKSVLYSLYLVGAKEYLPPFSGSKNPNDLLVSPENFPESFVQNVDFISII